MPPVIDLHSARPQARTRLPATSTRRLLRYQRIDVALAMGLAGLVNLSMLLIAAGDHPGRLRSEAAWAHLCAAAPIPASSGKVTRHRLNPHGDRQANHALYRIVITRMSSHPPTRAYVARRSKEGLSKKEIIRCLKRYVAREVYPHLRPGAG